jgi:hypothetical protein
MLPKNFPENPSSRSFLKIFVDDFKGTRSNGGKVEFYSLLVKQIAAILRYGPVSLKKRINCLQHLRR